MNEGIKAAAVLTLLTLLFVLSIQTVSSIGVHYELDKPYYHPGDTGKLSLTGDEDVMIFGVEMNITGIGVFKFDMTGIPEDRKVGFGPNNTLAYVWKKGETLSIDFKIPADAKPGEYSYTWSISWAIKMEMKKTDTLRVYAVGEEPSQSLNPFLLVLIAIPALLVAYPLVRWKSRKWAKVVVIAVIALTALGIVFGGFLFIFLIFNFITAFYPLLILLILAIVAALIIIRRRGRRQGERVQKPQKPPACPHCGRDLSQLPADIKNCPYCGKAVSTLSIEVKPAVKVEVPEGIKRIRRYAKMAALFGLVVAVASFIFGPLLGGFLAGPEPNAPYMFPVLHEYQGTLGNVTLVGILIAVASALVRAFSGAFKRKGGE